MADPTNGVRQAVYAKLAAAGLSAPVFSVAPANQPAPFVLVDEVALEAANTKSSRAWPVNVQIVSVVETTRPVEVESLMAAVVNALQDQAISLSGYTIFPLRLTASTAEPEPDGRLYFGRQTFRTTAQTN